MAHEGKLDPAAMWNERFGRPEPVYGEVPNCYLREQAVRRLTSDMKVLVPGDGYGRNGLWLARQGHTVTTVDISPVGVERSRKTAAATGISATILLADLTSWEWPLSEFDAVASIFLHLVSDERPRIHTHMLEALKPGGIIILEAFSPAQLAFTSGGPKQIDMLYTSEILRLDFKDAEVVELAESVVDLEEGRMHSGKGAVVRGVLRKR